jgi:hypothetical protein
MEMYYLTDGLAVAETRLMTEDEAVDANRRCDEITDGTWYWAVSPPKVDPRVVEGGGTCYRPDDIEGL